MAFELGWSSQPDEQFGFETGDGSRKSPSKQKGMDLKLASWWKKTKEDIFVFIIIKDTNTGTN